MGRARLPFGGRRARVGIAVSLVEILVGVAAGNLFHVPSATWIDFLAGFGSGLLTFLAGAEIEPQVVGKHWRQTLSIDLVGMVLAGTFLRERPLVLRLRAMVFTILTPFYCSRCGRGDRSA